MTGYELAAKRLLTEVYEWFDLWSPGDLGEYPECLDEIEQWLARFEMEEGNG